MKNNEGHALLRRGAVWHILGFALAFALVFGLLSTAISAETATAADMRLQSATGTVSLKNASGKSVSVREGMKLYSCLLYTSLRRLLSGRLRKLQG